MHDLQRPIVLVGFMASGKSKIGRRLAERLGVSFVDSDAEVERDLGAPIVEIFRTRGEPVFRQAERAVVARLITGGPRVIALGGGAFVEPETRETLKASAISIWLDPPFQLIAERLARSTSRPLASSRSQGELRQLWEQRRPSYAEADIRIETSNEDPERAVDRILERLQR